MAKKKKVGFTKAKVKALNKYLAMTPDELKELPYNELRGALQKANKRRNAILEKVKNRYEKGEYVSQIWEFRKRGEYVFSYANRITYDKENDTYDFVPYKITSGMTKKAIISELVNSKRLLNREESKISYMEAMEAEKYHRIKKWFEDNGYKKVSKEMAKKFGKLLKNLEDGGYIGGVDTYDSEQVIGKAVEYALQYKNEDEDELYERVVAWKTGKTKETEKEEEAIRKAKESTEPIATPAAYNVSKQIKEISERFKDYYND